LVIIGIILIFVLIQLFQIPEVTNTIRFIIIFLFLSLWLVVLLLFWEIKIFKEIFFIVSALFIFLLFPNGKKIDKSILQQQYTESLKKYEGVKYVWGGENRYGIDCSGLVRKGLIDAFGNLGVANFCPIYFKKALHIWFNDCTAKDLKNGYKGLTKEISVHRNLIHLDYKKIQSGDFMVTENGVHTMVYIGNNLWIEADPVKQKVIIINSSDTNFYWFNLPAKIMRWHDLE
jgi:energy-coupling factor transporter transmembrane protein EcfT